MITIQINNSGSAFDEPREEIARILRSIADTIENGGAVLTLVDINGNKCGTVAMDLRG
jgi:hypothetical protein